MSSLAQLIWQQNKVCWFLADNPVEVCLPSDVQFAIEIGSGVAVVAGTGNESRAYLLNLDGTIRCSLMNPFDPKEGMEFYSFEYEGSQLVVVVASALRDFVFSVDERTGSLSQRHETR